MGPLTQDLSFEISANKLHSISFVGGKFINIKDGFKIKIIDSKNNAIDSSKSLVKLPFSFKGNPDVETFYFAGQPGKYKIIVENIESLELRKSRLPTEQVFGQPIKANQIGLLVRETISDKQKISIFVLFIVGLLVINFAFILTWI